MKIETFQKIQQKLIDVILLSVSFFVAISIYLWQSLWDKYTAMTIIAFIASSILCLYYITVNISTKPWVYLRQTYNNNKKYKTLRKISQSKSQEAEKQTLSKNHQKSTQTFKNVCLSKPNHFSFSLQDETQVESPLKSIQKIKTQVKTLDSPLKRLGGAKTVNNFFIQSKITGKSSSKFSNELDPLQMFLYSSKQNQPRDRKFQQKINSDQIDKTEQDLKYEKDSEQVKKCIQNFISKQQSQETLRNEYDRRYQQYKKSLDQFQFNQLAMELLTDETKLIVREKIEENLKKQFENLDNIETILRKNFSVNFKSYKQRSEIKGANSFYGQKFGYLGLNKNRDTFNGGQSKYSSLNQQLKFSQVLQECVNLMNHHYFHFEYTGEVQKIDEIKSQLKLLTKQRLRLDEYLFLRWPLCIDKSNKSEKCEFKSEFEEQRYLHLIKLKNLAQILGQKKSAQQNLLKQFFSTQRTFFNQANEPLEQINDEKNIEFLMAFMMKVFQEKISNANASEYIEIKLSKPEFSNCSTNYIWVAKAKGMKSHYNIAYTCNINNENKSKQFDQPSVDGKSAQKQKEIKPNLVYCCPGEKNIWVCFAFIRQIISKIGLRSQKYPMIKNNELRKDFERLVEFLK